MGWSLERIEGLSWRAFVHPEDLPKMEADWAQALKTGEPYENTSRVRRSDGEYRWLLMQGAPLRDHDGKILRWYGINTDIEDRKRTEDALHKTQADLAHVTRMTTMGELTASIAHEVNQPLAAVVTNGEAGLRWLTRDVPDLGEVRTSVERMISNAQRASDVIARLRALSRRTDPEHLAVQVNDIVHDVVMLVQRELFNHRVALDLDLEPASLTVRGDRVQLQQVLINLVMNGIQAMESNGDRPKELLIVSKAHVDDNRDNFAVIEVQDSGTGISPEIANKVFSAFYTTKPNGMGMGLSICRSIVEAHGGRVRASPGPKSGASFTVALPLQPELSS